MFRYLPTCSLGLGLSISLLAPAASAHIEAIDPPARYEIQGLDTGIKSCPCGLGGSNRTCNVAADGSDPDRDESRASTFEAGSTVKLRFDEYIAHSGRYRVAFDPDGADFGDFNDNILLDVPDPSGNEGNTGEGSTWELEVTLPDTPCDNCTLQVIQAMHGDTENPVLDPANLSSYYYCVDLHLVAAGDGDPAEMGEGGTGGAPMDVGGASGVDDMMAAAGDMAIVIEAPDGAAGAAGAGAETPAAGADTQEDSMPLAGADGVDDPAPLAGADNAAGASAAAGAVGMAAAGAPITSLAGAAPIAAAGQPGAAAGTSGLEVSGAGAAAPGVVPMASGEDDSGGCSLTRGVPGPAGVPAGFALSLAALALARRRRAA